MNRRLFIGIKIHPSDKILEAINYIKLNLADEKIRWVNTDNFHFTLKFLGDTNVEKIGVISESLHKVASNFPPTETSIIEFGVFPRISKARVLWFGMRNFEQIEELNKAVEKEMVNLDFEKNDFEFKPHLTIARTKFLKQTKILKQLIEKYKSVELQKMSVEEIQLFESDLSKGSPIYTSLEKFKLTK